MTICKNDSLKIHSKQSRQGKPIPILALMLNKGLPCLFSTEFFTNNKGKWQGACSNVAGFDSLLSPISSLINKHTMATKICSAKPGKTVHSNVHTKTAHQKLMGKLHELGMDVKTYMVEVQIRREMRMLNLNLQP